jgi:hypothetical protein
VKFYRRVNIVQRQRRAVWDSQDVVNTNLDEPTRQARDSEHEEIPDIIAVEELSEASNVDDLDQLGDSVDTETFAQILEMDDSDDEIEREFSRSMTLDGLETIEQGIRQIQELL